ncbi:MAG TPA: ribokinase [Phycisphaerae bacterium]|nr:ribokinase [Phycisphaerae bacterium]
MADKPRILVVGSINMDLVVRSPHMPAPGETVLGEGFVTSPGGKGANQAVAAARLGARCRFLGRIGRDTFGQALLAGLRAEGIDCTDVIPTDTAATGVAMIIVDARGENSIVVASGANHRLTPDDVFARAEAFEQADAVVLQLELPLPTVRAAIEVARRYACKVILDPAPAPQRLPEALCHVDVISPNVTEAEMLTGSKTGEERADKNIAMDLIARGASAAVLKLGSRGSMVVTNDGKMARVPAFDVTIVDTTAAGDAFTAALAVEVAKGTDLRAAARVANAAGALACTRLGAQTAMPTWTEVRMLMEDQPGRD